jgi:murein DD-endopeptidase MepM/ murein hydrolase activator NlpD
LKRRYYITSSFQAHRNRTPPSKSPGIDLACPPGTDVRAWAGGKVARSRWSQGGGRSLWIHHGRGLQTYYAHLSCVHVLEGETVKAGQKIGESGNSGNTTGPHLHFSVIKKRQYVDPEEFLDF